MTRVSALALVAGGSPLVACRAVAAVAAAQPPAQPPAARPSAPKRTTCASTSIRRTTAQPVTDLTQDDFEILEDSAPQKIEQFEHVTIRGNVPQDTRASRTRSASRARWRRTRARASSCSFSTSITSRSTASHRIRQPLVNALDRLIGPDDLVGVMTPEMSARDITFARKTTTIEGLLSRYWYWGERDRLNRSIPSRSEYKACYPGRLPVPCPDGSSDDDRGIADEMIARRQRKADARRAGRSRRLSPRRARGAQGGARHQRRLAAVPPERQPRAQALLLASRPPASTSIRAPAS